MKKRFLVLTLLSLVFAFPSQSKAQNTYDWHISGGTVVDGSGSEAYRADLLIRSDSIAYIGEVDPDTIEVKSTVDAFGKIVAPGFIDTHTHGNPTETPRFRNFLAMGVTTIVLGQDGSSSKVGTLGEWFDAVEESRPSVNVATLTGHGSLRSRAGAGNRPANEQELRRMQQLLENDLKAGSFGMSTGLEYVPGMYADRDELLRMADVVGSHGGIVMSHMRSEDDAEIMDSIDELAALGKHAPVHISHLKVVYGKGEERSQEVLDHIDSLRKNGIAISADTYPYAASYTGIGIVFPDWAKTDVQWQQALTERPEVLRRSLSDKVAQRNGPDAILFGSGQYAGKTLQEVAAEKQKSAVDVLMEMGPNGASAAHFVMDEELQDRIAVDPRVMISSDGSPTMRHPRGYGSFAKVIRRYVMEQQVLSLEEAVRKMSGLPVQTMEIENRGSITVGNKADLILFQPEKVRDRATFEHPHRPAEGMEWVWVNGQLAIQEGVFNEEGFGVVLRKN